MTNEKMARVKEIAKEMGKLAEELKELGALSAMMEGRNSDRDYLVAIHMRDESVPASLGKVTYQRFDCGDTHDIERTVRVGKTTFFNIMSKKEAKKLMQEELLA